MIELHKINPNHRRALTRLCNEDIERMNELKGNDNERKQETA